MTGYTSMNKLLLTLTAVAAIGLAAVGWGGWWATHGRFLEHTDDAYVAGNVVQITPQISEATPEILHSLAPGERHLMSAAEVAERTPSAPVQQQQRVDGSAGGQAGSRKRPRPEEAPGAAAASSAESKALPASSASQG